MSANIIGQIVAEITANTAGLRRGAAEAKTIMKDTSDGASVAGKAIGVAFAVTAALGVVKLIDKLEDCTQVAIDNKKALMGLESVAKAYGVSADEAKKATQSFTQDGLLQMKSATIGMKNIISTGFNITEAMNLSEALKDIGAFNNVTGDLGTAFEDATKGMRTGSIELIENIGLTQKLSAVMKAAGVDISNGIDLTNNAAQREAFYNMVLKEGEKFKGNAAKLADDQASAQAKANAAMKEAADAIGNRLLPAYSSLMGAIADVAKEAKIAFTPTNLEKTTIEVEKQKDKLSELTGMYLTLKGETNKSNIEQDLFLKVINDLKTAYPDYLENLDLQNIKTSEAVKIFDTLNGLMEKRAFAMLAEAELADYYSNIANFKKQEYGWTEKLVKEKAKLLQLQKEEKKQANNKWENPITRVSRGVQIGLAEENISKYELQSKHYAGLVNGTLSQINAIKKKWSNAGKIFEVPSLNPVADAKAKAKAERKVREKAEAERKAREKAEADALAKKGLGKKESTGDETLKTTVTVEPKIEITDPDPPWIEVQNLIYSQFAAIKPEITPTINYDALEVAKQQLAVGLTDPNKYMTTFAQQGTGGEAKEVKIEAEYVNKTLDDVTKSFADLASVLDNDVLNALSNVANQAMNMKGSISGFSAAQGANDKLGMLSSGLGMFSSAVGIFSAVGGLFHKSTYNFDEAVKKMLAGIGEKTPELQVAEYKKAVDLKNYLTEQGLGVSYYTEITKAQSEHLKNMGIETKQDIIVNGGGSGSASSGAIKEVYYMGKTAGELLATLDKIIPQLAEQLGTAAGDFGSSIGSALSSATTSEELKANLYDSIYGTVKSGLINAFLAGEVMKPLLNRLQETVTFAVASGGIDDTERTAIQGLLGNVNTEAGKFYDALESVGLNVVDAAGQLNEAADRMDNVNRNLRLADRISTITTQTSTAGITQLAGNSSIVYDFSNANLGGMTEQQVISAVSKANRMASIRKVGV